MEISGAFEINTETSSNPRGSFVFTGLNTSQFVGGTPVAGTGFDFADFLLGLPQQTSVQYGGSAYGYHFRGNSWDLYAQDEWRVPQQSDLQHRSAIRICIAFQRDQQSAWST